MPKISWENMVNCVECHTSWSGHYFQTKCVSGYKLKKRILTKSHNQNKTELQVHCTKYVRKFKICSYTHIYDMICTAKWYRKMGPSAEKTKQTSGHYQEVPSHTLLDKTDITHVSYGGQLYSYYIFVTYEANHNIWGHVWSATQL
jgi:hypothetical protein